MDAWSHAQLAGRARAVAAALTERGLAGRPVLLLYPSGLEFVAAFLGCLYAGAIAVPAYPPDPARLARTLPRLQSIAGDSRAAGVLTSQSIAAMSQALAGFAPDLARLDWIASDGATSNGGPAASPWRRPDGLGPEAVAFLQYTSGSTSAPKGVVVTHANLMHNERVLCEAFGQDEGSLPLGWLPLFHDMGLIGHVLNPLYLGTTGTLMAPQDFLARPVEWLRAISRFRATTSGAPDFAYALCARKVTDGELAELDLSSWRLAYSGAEPVRSATMRAFADRMAPAGFRPEFLVPCYGLAESTLMATSAPRGRGMRAVAADPGALAAGRIEAPRAGGAATDLVSVGRPFLGMEVRVVHPDSRAPAVDGAIGEIWLRGPSVARGYWQSAEATAAVFGARTADGEGPWLRTGDLGALSSGELFVTGRAKDVIIVRGRNLFPEDLEPIVEACHPAIRRGCSVAFAVDVAGEEQVAVACEVNEGADPDSVAEAVRGAVTAAADAPLHAVALLERHALPKTSSGKRQRQAARRAFADGTPGEIARVTFAAAPPVAAADDHEGPPTTLADMEAWLARQVAAVVGRPPDRIERDASFESLGLDSLRAVELASRLELRLGRPLHPTVLYNVPTVGRLAAWLVQGRGAAAAADSRALYPDVTAALERLDRRNPATYRFDLERDIAWHRTAEPGDYICAELFAALGLDVAAVAREPDAWRLLQTASAMTTCTAFEVAEVTITLFIDTYWNALGATRSLELFREEESKHVRLFRRYSDALRGLHPDLVVELGWDASWGVGFWELFRNPQLFPDERVFHYLFWFFFVAFEEHSIYMADLLARASGIQPAWLDVHVAHRREEIQHVGTDYAYAGALDLPAAERDAWSEVCVAWLCQHFDTFFAFGPARRLVAKRFPHLSDAMRTKGFVRSPFLQDLLHAPSFRRTRQVCPYLRDLDQLDPSRWPTDAELARRLPARWLEGRAAVAPSAVDAVESP